MSKSSRTAHRKTWSDVTLIAQKWWKKEVKVLIEPKNNRSFKPDLVIRQEHGSRAWIIQLRYGNGFVKRFRFASAPQESQFHFLVPQENRIPSFRLHTRTGTKPKLNWSRTAVRDFRRKKIYLSFIFLSRLPLVHFFIAYRFKQSIAFLTHKSWMFVVPQFHKQRSASRRSSKTIANISYNIPSFRKFLFRLRRRHLYCPRAARDKA